LPCIGPEKHFREFGIVWAGFGLQKQILDPGFGIGWAGFGIGLGFSGRAGTPFGLGFEIFIA
jgi:hypothetical protein